MAGLIIGKRDGKWIFQARGCCDTTATQALYDRQHALQVLGDGGNLARWDADGFELRDRVGRSHRYPRGWRPAADQSASSSSSAT